jgi:hypothetical protein
MKALSLLYSYRWFSRRSEGDRPFFPKEKLKNSLFTGIERHFSTGSGTLGSP